jgi:cryptochrome
LFISWEEGARVFDRDLVDADWALNNGNWMWLSASSFFYQYFRVYGPHSFAKKYDKEGAYVKHFLPVLKDMPSKYVYEPWTAPLEVQKKAGCIVGVDYPKPMVDHAIASKQCMAWMNEAYAAGKEKKSGGEEKSNKKAKTK